MCTWTITWVSWGKVRGGSLVQWKNISTIAQSYSTKQAKHKTCWESPPKAKLLLQQLLRSSSTSTTTGTSASDAAKWWKGLRVCVISVSPLGSTKTSTQPPTRKYVESNLCFQPRMFQPFTWVARWSKSFPIRFWQTRFWSFLPGFRVGLKGMNLTWMKVSWSACRPADFSAYPMLPKGIISL